VGRAETLRGAETPSRGADAYYAALADAALKNARAERIQLTPIPSAPARSSSLRAERLIAATQ
jgi:hypothetical protein